MSNPTHSGGIADATPTAPMPEPERTPCCNATLTGTDDGPACRNCYEYVSPSEMLTDATPTAPTHEPRFVTMRWDELTTAERLAVAETANAMAAGSLDVDRLRTFLAGRHEAATLHTVAVFAATVRRIVDAMRAYECDTVDDLRAAVDVAPYCDRLENAIADSLQAVTDVDTAIDDAMVVGLAAQIAADAVAAQNRANR